MGLQRSSSWATSRRAEFCPTLLLLDLSPEFAPRYRRCVPLRLKGADEGPTLGVLADEGPALGVLANKIELLLGSSSSLVR